MIPNTAEGPTRRRGRLRNPWPWIAIAASLPFLFCIVFGGLLPQVDFDVKEYHFGGPKEWYQQGRITFLPHNVYTSFPFLTEMLILAGMIIKQDWYWGAVSGNGVLLCFAPLTSLGLYAAGRRWYGQRAGLLAAWLYICTPWVFRISNIAYTEGGLSFYLFAALFAGLLAIDHFQIQSDDPHQRSTALRLALVAGFLAGSAMACKYPGVLSVVIPIGALILFGNSSPPKESAPSDSANPDPKSLTISLVRPNIKAALIFTLGVACAIGPWLIKNAVQTRNPVYPLLYSVFGGRDWDAELDAKWKHAHSPSHHHLSDIPLSLADIATQNDWQSPLLFSLAPLAFFHSAQRRRTLLLTTFLAYLFLTWWIFTHRIDRFWVPLIPVVALLAGIGGAWPFRYEVQKRPQEDDALQTLWGGFVLLTCSAVGVFLLAFISSGLCGYNAFYSDLEQTAKDTAQITSPEIVEMNERFSQRPLPAGGKVLFVGDAEIFDARFPLVYNTVFDKSLFEEWCGLQDHNLTSANRPLKSPQEVRRTLADNGITHIYVNWMEILRYREPGSYGYTDFVSPRRFAELQHLGILDQPWSIPGAFQLWEKLSPGSQEEINRWAPELKQKFPEGEAIKSFEVYPVRK